MFENPHEKTRELYRRVAKCFEVESGIFLTFVVNCNKFVNFIVRKIFC